MDHRIKELKKHTAPYEHPDTTRSVKQLLNTIPPFFLLWYLAYLSLSVSYWLTIPVILLAAGFLVRIFILFHDCCHQSLFPSRRANDIIGTVTGAITLVPYRQWRRSHSIHHATCSNLDKRGIGDIWIMTVEEFYTAPWWKRFAYRFYRNPFVMFGLGPIYVFLIQYRFNARGAKRAEKLNTYLTNVLIAAFYGLAAWAAGWQAFLLIQGPIFYIAGMAGIWLFYVQHQFEDTYFVHDPEWSYVNAAVEGSSYYKLPKVLQWLTGNIGFHHVHHLSPKVPNYYLQNIHDTTPPLQHAATLTLSGSLKALRFRLWDENSRQFLSFREAKQVWLRQAGASRESVSAAVTDAVKEHLAGLKPGWQE